jgi:hypothetical protein
MIWRTRYTASSILLPYAGGQSSCSALSTRLSAQNVLVFSFENYSQMLRNMRSVGIDLLHVKLPSSM